VRRDAERAAPARCSGFERIDQQPIIGQQRSAASCACVRFAHGVRDLLEATGDERRRQLALGQELPAVAAAASNSRNRRIRADYLCSSEPATVAARS
jgi:hypothetical protein